MKRSIVPVLLLLLGCSNSPTTPQVSTVALTRTASDCSILDARRGDGFEYQVGSVWRWHITGSFFMNCPDGAKVTLFYIAPDDSRTMFGSGFTTDFDPYRFAVDGKAPSFLWDDQPGRFPTFDAEVSRNGQLIGTYRFTTVIQLTPNTPHAKAHNTSQ